MKRKRVSSSITQDEIDKKITKLLDTEDIYLEDNEFGGTLGKRDFECLHVKDCGNIIDELIKKGIPPSSIKKMIEEKRLTRSENRAVPDDWQYKRLHKLLEPKLKEEIKLTNSKRRSSLYKLLREHNLTDTGPSISKKLDDETLKGLLKKTKRKCKKSKRKKRKSKRKKRKSIRGQTKKKK